MNAHPAIEHNHMALKRILIALVAMAGLVGGDTTLPRRLHRAVLRLLRPTEAATRRLIIALSRNMRAPKLPPPRKRKPQMPILRNGVGTGILAPVRVPFQSPIPIFATSANPASPRNEQTSRPLSFQLLDALIDPLRRPSRRRASGFPRITGFGPDDPPRAPVPPPPSPGDRVDATRLAGRLAALGHALDDLPAQARRFKRWQALNARRQSRSASSSGPARRLSPLRPGRPPGSPPRHARPASHEIYGVLAHTHSLALYALERRNTS